MRIRQAGQDSRATMHPERDNDANQGDFIDLTVTNIHECAQHVQANVPSCTHNITPS